MTGSPTDNSFLPPRWLRGRHFQTVLPSLLWRGARVRRRALPMIASADELLLDCGDGVKLQAFHSSPAKRGREPGKRLAVLLHGWEGSTDSTYVMSLGQSLFAAGLEVVRLNLRDHGATHHLNRDLFHSCRLPEVVGAVRAVAQKFPDMPMVLAGFSLGGNFMLRVAADPEAKHLPLERVMAVCPVLDPAVTMSTLENGFPLYHGYFVRKWTRSLAKKQMAWPEHYDFDDLLRVRSLREMTRLLVASHTEYSSPWMTISRATPSRAIVWPLSRRRRMYSWRWTIPSSRPRTCRGWRAHRAADQHHGAWRPLRLHRQSRRQQLDGPRCRRIAVAEPGQLGSSPGSVLSF